MKNGFTTRRAIRIMFVFLTAILIHTGLADVSTAGTISLVYDFDAPRMETVTIEGTVYDRIIMKNAPNGGSIGHPALPAAGAQILLPYGEDVVAVDVYPDGELSLGSGYTIEPVGTPYALSKGPQSVPAPAPDKAVYASDQPFPGNEFDNITTQAFRGYRILYLKLNPVQYKPASGQLFYSPRLKVVVTTAPADKSMSLFRGLAADELDIRNKVDNPDEASSYLVAGKNGAKSYDLLIITTPELAATFQPLKDYHDTTGILTEIHTTAEIGSSEPDDIRAFITTEYQNNGIEYALIGGDDNVLPAKDLYVKAYSEYIEYEMPTDMFLGCLDGTWDWDGDGVWGELGDGDDNGEVDLVADVYIGRAPVGNIGEAMRFVSKTIQYLSERDPYLKKVLLVGETLGFGEETDPGYYGGNSMDQLVNSSSSDDYFTIGIPSMTYTIDKLYDRSWVGHDWPQSEIVDRINSGQHIINHLGHGNTSGTMKMNTADIVDQLTNTDHYFLYSQACYSGAFDYEDCFAEYNVIKTDFGAFAVVMNARYGFGSSTTDGTSQRYNREFWDAVFNTSENKPQLGKANQDSKEDNIYRIREACMRWIYYELNLFGDPTVAIHKDYMDNPVNAFYDDAYGDGDGILEAGETGELVCALKNVGPATAENVTITLRIDDGSIDVVTPTVSLGDIPANSNASNYLTPLEFTIPADYSSRIDSFYLDISWNGGAMHASTALEYPVGAPRILLVDDDLNNSLETYYEDAFNDLRIPHERLSQNSYQYPDTAYMCQFDYVVWFTGFAQPAPINADEIISMKTYLDHGGNLFLTGQKIAAHLNDNDPDFLHDYLHADLMASNLSVILTAVPGAAVMQSDDSLFIMGSDGANNQYYPDHLMPLNGAVPELTYWDDDYFGALSYVGDYRLVFFGFGFEAAVGNDPRWQCRDSIMIKVLDFFNYDDPNTAARALDITVSPGNQMNLVDHTPTISWTYDDPTGNPQQMFEVQVSNENYWVSPDMWESGPQPGSATSIVYGGAALVDGEDYAIRVRVFNGILWSDWYNATMRMNSPPEQAYNMTPDNMTVTAQEYPSLSHRNPNDAENDVLSYMYELYGDAAMTELVTREVDYPAMSYITSWTPDVALADDEDYYWRVQAFDGFEYGEFTDLAEFATNTMNTDPTEFTVLSPSDGATLGDTATTFTWESSFDTDAYDELEYTIQISGVSSFATTLRNYKTTETSYTVNLGLQHDFTFYWRVVAEDNFGGQVYSGNSCCFKILAAGDCNSDGTINVGDAVFLVNYIFKEGQAPNPVSNGDANCDDAINVGDAVSIINFVFKGGSAPGCY